MAIFMGFELMIIFYYNIVSNLYIEPTTTQVKIPLESLFSANQKNRTSAKTFINKYF